MMAGEKDLEFESEAFISGEGLTEASASLEDTWSKALIEAGADPEQAKVKAAGTAGKIESQLAFRLQQAPEGVPARLARFRVLIYYKPAQNKDFDSVVDEIAKELRRQRGESAESTGGLESLELSVEEFTEAFSVLESAADQSAGGLISQLEREGGEFIENLRLADAVVARLNAEQIQELAKRDDVERIEIDKKIFTDLDKSIPTIHLPEARTQGLLGEGRGIVVAVLDGEIGPHPDLEGRVQHKRNYTQEGWGGEGSTHGLHVAGIIAGNGSKYRGVAPQATIWNYKLFPTGGAESTESAFLEAQEGSTGADAIEDAVKHGAKILNCSWGIGVERLDGNSVWAVAAERAARLGVVVCKSAGNKGPDASSLTTPADARGDVIVVGAVNRSGTAIASFSSRGPTADGREKPDICAPGERIMSASPGGGHRALSGTSMATPHVSGLAALLLERHPKWKAADVKRALMDTADPLTTGDVSANDQGRGLVNAVKAAGGTAAPSPPGPGEEEGQPAIVKALEALRKEVAALRKEVAALSQDVAALKSTSGVGKRR